MDCNVVSINAMSVSCSRGLHAVQPTSILGFANPTIISGAVEHHAAPTIHLSWPCSLAGIICHICFGCNSSCTAAPSPSQGGHYGPLRKQLVYKPRRPGGQLLLNTPLVTPALRHMLRQRRFQQRPGVKEKWRVLKRQLRIFYATPRTLVEVQAPS